MTLKLVLLFFLLCYQIYEDKADDAKEARAIWTKYYNHTKEGYKQHWHPNDTQKIKFGRWLKTYYATQKPDKIGKNPKGMELPYRWQGMGEGHKGQDPPPWAELQGQQGKPMICFDDISTCRGDRLQRWGYNYFRGICEIFWSSCPYSYNVFFTNRSCMETCG